MATLPQHHPPSRISTRLALAVCGLHLIPLGLLIWSVPGATDDLAAFAAATLPVLGLVVAAQVLLLAPYRPEAGLVAPRSGALIWTAPPIAAAVALFAVGGGGGTLPDLGVTLIIAGVVVAVVAEEITFRGAVFGVLARHSELAAVFGSALLFGAAHTISLLAGVAPAPVATQVLGAFGLGLVLGVVRLRTGSLAGPIVIHAVWNGAALSGDLEAGPLAEPLAAIVVVAAMLGALSLVALRRRVALGL